MKLRKVGLSLLLTIAMVLTLLPAMAFARNAEINDTYELRLHTSTLNILKGDTAENSAALYMMSSNDPVNGDDVNILWTTNNPSIATIAEKPFSPYEPKSITDDVTGEAIKVTGISVGTTTVTATASIAGEQKAQASFTVKVGADAISAGQTKQVSLGEFEQVYYSFTPSNSGYYIFYSEGGGLNYGDLDPECELRFPEGEQMPSEDPYAYKSNDAQGTNNFEACFPVTANKTYYLKAYSWNGKPATYTVSLKIHEKATAEVMIAEADTYQESDYTPSSYESMKKARDDLSELLQDSTATDAQIKEAIDALGQAINNLELKASPPQKDDNKKEDNKQEDSKKAVTTVTVNVKTVNATAIANAITAAGGSSDYATKIILGSKVKKISKGAFKPYAKVTDLEVQTKKLTKKSVKGSLKGSQVKRIKVKVAKKAKTNKKYKKKYKKIFTKKNTGKKVSVK